MIEVHPSAKVSRLAEIEESVRGTRIVLAEGVVIDAFVKILWLGFSAGLERHGVKLLRKRLLLDRKLMGRLLFCG